MSGPSSAEDELSRFRQQWQEEVTRKKAPQREPSHASSAGPSKSKLKAPAFRARRTSTSRPAADGEEEPGEDDEPVQPPRGSGGATRRDETAAFDEALGVPVSALDHYEKAVEKETQGSLGESLKLYRQAYRMDDGVDKIYKNKHFPRPAASSSKSAAGGPVPPAPPTGVNTAHHSSAAPSKPLGVSDLIASFAGLRIEPVQPASLSSGDAESSAKPLEPVHCPLDSIPSELLLHILRDLALIDLASFTRISQVCKALCYVVSTEQAIYRAVCSRLFQAQVWDWLVSVSGKPLYVDNRLGAAPSAESYEVSAEEDIAEDPEEEERTTRLPQSDEEELPNYDHSWRTMVRLRPRIRYNGIYISTCNYLRPGGASATAVTWNSAVHIVTYYRYLRFYPDGTVLSLLTTHEPAEVVYHFTKPALTPAHLGGLPAGSATAAWSKYVSRGRWRMDREGRVDVETVVPGMDRYLFRMQLRVQRVGRKGAAKLAWEGFWSWNRLTEDLAEFRGRNDKPFFFSRVGVVEKEMEKMAAEAALKE